MPDENKYEGLARFTWLVSGLLALGATVKWGLGWGIITLALSLFVLVTSTVALIIWGSRGEDGL